MSREWRDVKKDVFQDIVWGGGGYDGSGGGCGAGLIVFPRLAVMAECAGNSRLALEHSIIRIVPVLEPFR